MKKRRHSFFIAAFVFMSLNQVSAQQQVRINPNPHDWKDLVSSGFIVGDNGDGVDTTNAFEIRKWQGITTLWLDPSDGSDTDTCMTVYTQLYNVSAGAWGAPWNSSDYQKARIDTVARTFWANDSDAFMDIPGAANTGWWAYADSARFILSITAGDSITFNKIQVGGQ